MKTSGCEVHVLTLEAQGQLPADPEEIQEAIEEGVKFHYSGSVKEIRGVNGKVSGLITANVIRLFDDEGCFSPMCGDELTDWNGFDGVIIAIGQRPDLSFAGDKPIINEQGNRLVADRDTLATSVPGIFAGGDVQTGPRLLIDAVGAGKRAAESIHRYIQGEDLRAGRTFLISPEEISPLRQKKCEVNKEPAIKQSYISPEIRSSGFNEVALGYSEEQACAEAERCLNCAVCSECLQCVDVCIPKAINHEMRDQELEYEVGALVLNPGFKPYDPVIYICTVMVGIQMLLLASSLNGFYRPVDLSQVI
nr:FAD-dependent oxidoreductase [Desulforamulus aquiferis]